MWLKTIAPYLVLVVFPRDSANMDDVHSGPHDVPVNGFLTKSQRADLLKKYGCHVHVRYRESWGKKGMTVSGPASTITKCKEAARGIVNENVKNKAEGDDSDGTPTWIVGIAP